MRKICLVVDQKSDTLELAENYKDFKCDGYNHNYLLTTYLTRENGVQTEPTLKDHSARALEIEFMMSEEPYVKALTDIDGGNLARGI